MGLTFRASAALAGMAAFCGVVCASTSERPIRQIVSELRHREVPPHGWDIDVPPDVARNLTALKHALRDLIIESVSVTGATAQTPDALAARVTEELESEDVPIGDEGGFGAITEIRFRRPLEYPAWLIAATSLSIPFGVDVSLYVFEIEGAHWKHALTLDSNGYSVIHDAQGWLHYYVAPPVPGRKPYLVTAEISPASFSVWQALRISVLRVGARPEKPVVLAHRALSYCLDEPYYVSVLAEDFGLMFLDFAADPELAGWRGVHYIEYDVGLERASIARDTVVDPYKMIQAWAARDWSSASHSLDPDAATGAREWHARFREREWGCGLGRTRLGHRMRADREQLVAEAECSRSDSEKAQAYVLLTAGREGFRIASISRAQQLSPEQWEMVYRTGIPGLTDPVLETMTRPRLPVGAGPSATPVMLKVAIVVNEDGRVGSARAAEWPRDDKRIVVTALRAVRQWKYKPGFFGGHPVKVELDVEVQFEQ